MMSGAKPSHRTKRLAQALAGVSAVVIGIALVPQVAAAQAAPASDAPAGQAESTAAPLLPPDQAAGNGSEDKDVVVTGSYLPQSGGTGSPVATIDLKKEQPVTTLGELFLRQPEFNGNAVLSDPGANSQTGASFINLRGLGPNATLVLLNGVRQTVNSQPNTRGQYGVDSESLTPAIMLSRVEVVKDGASAIYGTDAVAGVVNFITDKKFTGFEMQGNLSQTEVGGQTEYTIGARIGGGGDRWHFVLGGEYVRRDPLDYYDYQRVVDYANQPGTLTLSTFNNPGTYRPIAGQTYNGLIPAGTPTSQTFADPLCGDPSLGSGGVQGVLVTTGASTSCRGNTQLGRSVLGGEDRVTMLATGTYEVSDYFKIDAQAGFTVKDLFRDGAYGLNVAFAPVVPESNPGNPFGGAVTFSGRVPGAASGMMLASPTYTQTYHGAISINGKLPVAALEKSDWHYDVGIDFSENHSNAYQQDTVKTDLQNALNGLGGPNCNPATGTPGVGNCMYYNPFANSVHAAPGSPQYNSPDLMNWLLPAQNRDTTARLMTWHAIVRGNLFNLPGGPVAIAIGYEGRHESLRSTTDPVTHDGGWSFITQEFDFDAGRTYNAGFFEVRLPFIDQFEVQAAGRYEGYQGHSSFNPKIGFIGRPFSWISVRGTYGQSFQAPTLQSVYGTGTSSVNGIVFPGVNTVSTKAVVSPNPDLAPQKSKSYTAGIDLKPLPGLTLSTDFYKIDFTDLVGQETPQLLVNEYLATGANADRFVFDPTGTSLVTLYLHNINASSVITDGFDFSGSYTQHTGAGIFNLAASATLIGRYDFQQSAGGTVIHAVGGSNQGTSIPALPRWKADASLTWSLGPSRAMLSMDYMSGLTNPAFTLDSPLQNTASYTTFDFSYSYSFKSVLGGPLTVQVGVDNLFDKLPPFQAGQQFYPLFSGVYDPRGRRYTLNIKKSF
jgi:iron complex outermembrane receptor protein